VESAKHTFILYWILFVSRVLSFCAVTNGECRMNWNLFTHSHMRRWFIAQIFYLRGRTNFCAIQSSFTSFPPDSLRLALTFFVTTLIWCGVCLWMYHHSFARRSLHETITRLPLCKIFLRTHFTCCFDDNGFREKWNLTESIVGCAHCVMPFYGRRHSRYLIIFLAKKLVEDSNYF
jgi:hypothetical protein